MRNLLHFLILLTFILPLVSCSVAQYSEVASKSFDSSAIKAIKLQTQNGNVNIKTWKREEIKVDITKTVKGIENLESEINKISISFEQNDGVLSCIIKMPKASSFLISYSADIIVRLPKRMFENVDIKTLNGSVTVENTVANFMVRTSNGKIDVYQSIGTFDLKTSNGQIYLKGVQIFKDENEIETSNGDITGNLKLPSSGSLLLKTHNGDINLELLGFVKADLEAKTSNGEIVIKDLNLITEKREKKLIKGKINNGGFSLKISSSNGDILIQGIPAIPI